MTTSIDRVPSAYNRFCDEEGKGNDEFPAMTWKNKFQPEGAGTKVTIEVTFKSEEDLNKIVGLGFEVGFTAALGNLDALLAKKRID